MKRFGDLQKLEVAIEGLLECDFFSAPSKFKIDDYLEGKLELCVLEISN